MGIVDKIVFTFLIGDKTWAVCKVPHNYQYLKDVRIGLDFYY